MRKMCYISLICHITFVYELLILAVQIKYYCFKFQSGTSELHRLNHLETISEDGGGGSFESTLFSCII